MRMILHPVVNNGWLGLGKRDGRRVFVYFATNEVTGGSEKERKEHIKNKHKDIVRQVSKKIKAILSQKGEWGSNPPSLFINSRM